ncbi:MAG: hypothetical protein KKB21_02065, partial [Nanoarchaeota archaeon]|nr:hypothetical protein [Nanoarchaeota archaeon]
MDNGIIRVLESVASIMYLICTIMSTIDSILHKVQIFMACCLGPAENWANPACLAKNAEVETWEISNMIPYVKPICCFVNCGWCGGLDGKGASECWGSEIASISPVNMIASGISPSKDGGISGVGSLHLSPFENIYMAVGCMCPVAILFNLRKLATIYEVYDCCIQEACANGLTTEGCEQQLKEATCMYWQGSALKMLAKIIVSLLASWLIEPIVKDLVKTVPGLACVMAVLDLAQIPGEIQGVKAAFDWTKRTFKKPSCKDLGFDKIKKQMESGTFSQSAGTNSLTLNDKDGDGRYDIATSSTQPATSTQTAGTGSVITGNAITGNVITGMAVNEKYTTRTLKADTESQPLRDSGKIPSDWTQRYSTDVKQQYILEYLNSEGKVIARQYNPCGLGACIFTRYRFVDSNGVNLPAKEGYDGYQLGAEANFLNKLGKVASDSNLIKTPTSTRTIDTAVPEMDCSSGVCIPTDTNSPEYIAYSLFNSVGTTGISPPATLETTTTATETLQTQPQISYSSQGAPLVISRGLLWAEAGNSEKMANQLIEKGIATSTLRTADMSAAELGKSLAQSNLQEFVYIAHSAGGTKDDYEKLSSALKLANEQRAASGLPGIKANVILGDTREAATDAAYFVNDENIVHVTLIASAAGASMRTDVAGVEKSSLMNNPKFTLQKAEGDGIESSRVTHWLFNSEEVKKYVENLARENTKTFSLSFVNKEIENSLTITSNIEGRTAEQKLLLYGYVAKGDSLVSVYKDENGNLIPFKINAKEVNGQDTRILNSLTVAEIKELFPEGLSSVQFDKDSALPLPEARDANTRVALPLLYSIVIEPPPTPTPSAPISPTTQPSTTTPTPITTQLDQSLFSKIGTGIDALVFRGYLPGGSLTAEQKEVYENFGELVERQYWFFGDLKTADGRTAEIAPDKSYIELGPAKPEKGTSFDVSDAAANYKVTYSGDGTWEMKRTNGPAQTSYFRNNNGILEESSNGNSNWQEFDSTLLKNPIDMKIKQEIVDKYPETEIVYGRELGNARLIQYPDRPDIYSARVDGKELTISGISNAEEGKGAIELTREEIKSGNLNYVNEISYRYDTQESHIIYSRQINPEQKADVSYSENMDGSRQRQTILNLENSQVITFTEQISKEGETKVFAEVGMPSSSSTPVRISEELTQNLFNQESLVNRITNIEVDSTNNKFRVEYYDSNGAQTTATMTPKQDWTLKSEIENSPVEGITDKKTTIYSKDYSKQAEITSRTGEMADEKYIEITIYENGKSITSRIEGDKVDSYQNQNLESLAIAWKDFREKTGDSKLGLEDIKYETKQVAVNQQEGDTLKRETVYFYTTKKTTNQKDWTEMQVNKDGTKTITTYKNGLRTESEAYSLNEDKQRILTNNYFFEDKDRKGDVVSVVTNADTKTIQERQEFVDVFNN